VVLRIYRENDWRERDRKVFEASLGLEEKSIDERGRDEVKAIVAGLEEARIVIFRD
jgi:hypothetical protein